MIRAARHRDLRAIVTLCREHAALERSRDRIRLTPARLRRVLFGRSRRLVCLVGVNEGHVIAIAMYTIDVSTWRAVSSAPNWLGTDASDRRRGETTEVLGLEWQTPVWNAAAMRFYRRLGARSALKQRFHWRV